MTIPKELTEHVKDFTHGGGAEIVGIVTTETLQGGPPSTDLSFILPLARSAVVFALPLDQQAIDSFLNKTDFKSLNINNRRINTMANGIAFELSSYLNMKGFKSVPVAANNVYRKEASEGYYSQFPPLAHRYLAARSGIGYFGLSGNIITESHGANIILGSVVTEAELKPTDPLPEENNYCDDCRLCQKTCISGLMSETKKTKITMGGIEFYYSKRKSYNRCNYICGGFSGLHPSGKWSTWSPARFPIPEKDEDFLTSIRSTYKSYKKRYKQNFGANFYHPTIAGNRIEFTCGHCQFICHPDKKVRIGRYKMITQSGVIIQDKEGHTYPVNPETALKHIKNLSKKTRALYVPENDND